MSIYKPKYYKLHELLDPITYTRYGSIKGWWFTDNNLNRFIDMIKERYSPNHPVTINNWWWNKEEDWNASWVYCWSGRRLPQSPWWDTNSQHSLCRAYDLKFDKSLITAEEVREDLRNNWGKLKSQDFSITAEKGVSWVHIDTRPQKDIYNEF